MTGSWGSEQVWSWTVELERHRRVGPAPLGAWPARVRWQGKACSEDEAIGKALREHGLHDGWEVIGWWPTERIVSDPESVDPLPGGIEGTHGSGGTFTVTVNEKTTGPIPGTATIEEVADACYASGISLGEMLNAFAGVDGPADDTHPCSACGRTYYELMGSYWLTSDDLWQQVVGDPRVVLCPRCFTRRAEAAGFGVHWEPVLERESGYTPLHDLDGEVFVDVDAYALKRLADAGAIKQRDDDGAWQVVPDPEYPGDEVEAVMDSLARLGGEPG